MAIQNRRGPYEKLDTTKLLPGEPAVVLQGDPLCEDGKSVYICFTAGDAKRMATYEDMVENIDDATEEVQLKFTEEVRAATDNANTQAGYAKAQGDYAGLQGDYAKEQGNYAKTQGDYAKAQGDYAGTQGAAASAATKECKTQTTACESATQSSINQTIECKSATESAIEAAMGHSIIYDPSDGNRETVQEVINHIWVELLKMFGSPLTAGEYDAIGLTAGEYDAKKLTANEYDTRAGAILK